MNSSPSSTASGSPPPICVRSWASPCPPAAIRRGLSWSTGRIDFIHMEEDIIKETAESVGLGLGIRVLSGDKTGFGYTNDLSLDKVRKAALTAAAIASGKLKARAGPAPGNAPRPEAVSRRRPRPDMAGLGKKIALVQEAYGAARPPTPRSRRSRPTSRTASRYRRSPIPRAFSSATPGPWSSSSASPSPKRTAGASPAIGAAAAGSGWRYFRDVLTPRAIGERGRPRGRPPPRGRGRPGRRDAHRPRPGPQRRPHPRGRRPPPRGRLQPQENVHLLEQDGEEGRLRPGHDLRRPDHPVLPRLLRRRRRGDRAAQDAPHRKGRRPGLPPGPALGRAHGPAR